MWNRLFYVLFGSERYIMWFLKDKMSSSQQKRKGSTKGETPKSKNSTESPSHRVRKNSDDSDKSDIKSNGGVNIRRTSSMPKEGTNRPPSRGPERPPSRGPDRPPSRGPDRPPSRGPGKGSSQKRRSFVPDAVDGSKSRIEDVEEDQSETGSGRFSGTFPAIDIIRENGSEYVSLQHLFNGMPGTTSKESSKWDNLCRGTISSSLKRLDNVETEKTPSRSSPRQNSKDGPSLKRSGSVTLGFQGQQVSKSGDKNPVLDSSPLKRSVSNIDFQNKNVQRSVSKDEVERSPSNSSLNSQTDLTKPRSGSGRYEKEYMGQIVKLRRPKNTEVNDDRRKSTNFDSPVTRRTKNADQSKKRWSLNLDTSLEANFTGRKEIASPTVPKTKKRVPSGGDYSAPPTSMLASTPVCFMDLDKVIQLFRVDVPGTIEEVNKKGSQ